MNRAVRRGRGAGGRLLAGAVTRVVARVPGLTPQDRAELVELAVALGRERGLRGYLLELCGLLGLWLERVLVGSVPVRRSAVRRQGLLLGVAWAAGVGLLERLLPVGPVRVTTVVVLVGVLGVWALVLGRFDPRLPIAVLVLWGWRLVALDLEGARAALVAWSIRADDGQSLLRWCVMAAGVLVALHVARRSDRGRALPQ